MLTVVVIALISLAVIWIAGYLYFKLFQEREEEKRRTVYPPPKVENKQIEIPFNALTSAKQILANPLKARMDLQESIDRNARREKFAHLDELADKRVKKMKESRDDSSIEAFGWLTTFPTHDTSHTDTSHTTFGGGDFGGSGSSGSWDSGDSGGCDSGGGDCGSSD